MPRTNEPVKHVKLKLAPALHRAVKRVYRGGNGVTVQDGVEGAIIADLKARGVKITRSMHLTPAKNAPVIPKTG